MNKKVIIIGVSVLALAGLAYLGYKWYSKNKAASIPGPQPTGTTNAAQPIGSTTQVLTNRPGTVAQAPAGQGRG